MFRTKIQVRYVETDQMGIVHHSGYFPWFEVGRTEFFKQTGLSYDEIERSGVLLPLVDCYCKFIYSAKYGDEVWIEVNLESVSVAKCKFTYNIIRAQDEKLLATGYTQHGFTTDKFKPINLKKSFPDIYELLCELRGVENDT